MDERRLVQFLHPGREHAPDSRGHRAWNSGPHRRKFIEAPGHIAATPGASPNTALLRFWGEWEPPSHLVEEIARPPDNGPRYVWNPYLPQPDSWISLQDTDPLVFGDSFLYTNCQQHRATGPTVLQRLGNGSIVLFGSAVGRRFSLDTVLVVRESGWVDSPLVLDDLPTFIGADQVDTIWNPLLPNVKVPYTYRAYRGATAAEPIYGLFSFFPALPAEAAPSGFARPTIELPGRVTVNQSQGFKTTVLGTATDASEVWHFVVDQVLGQGLQLGTHAAMPPREGWADGTGTPATC